MLRRAAKLAYHAALKALPDPLERRLVYLRSVGLRHPRTLSDKITYHKLFVRDPRIPRLIDKIDAKAEIAKRLGDDWIIPTYYSGTNLPPRTERNWPFPFIIKAAHSSGELVIVRSESDLDWPSIEDKCARWTASHYKTGAISYEWAYAKLTPRILVEQYLGGDEVPNDHKCYVIHGNVALIQVDFDRFGNHTRNHYDRDWNKVDVTVTFPDNPEVVPAPPHFAQMIAGAERIGSEFEFVRVDLYDTPSGPKFGEATFWPFGGWVDFRPRIIDEELGRLW